MYNRVSSFTKFNGLHSCKTLIDYQWKDAVDETLFFYYRDKDNNSAIVPPLEVHVDVISSTVQYHRGGSVESTDNGQSKTSGSHGSPTSSRSVNFATTDDSTTRRSKR